MIQDVCKQQIKDKIWNIWEELILQGVIYLQVEKCDYKRDSDFVSN